MGKRATVLTVVSIGLCLSSACRRRAETGDPWQAGRAQAQRGGLVVAEKTYKDMLEDAPDGPSVRAALGMIYLLQDRLADARTITESCGPGGPEAMQPTAPLCAFVYGLADESAAPAIASGLMEVSGYPGDARALAGLLDARVAMGPDDVLATEEAARTEILLASAATDGHAARVLPFFASYVARFRAQVRLLAGNAAGAREILEAAAVAHPEDALVWFQLAGARDAAGDRPHAIEALDKFDSLWPDGNDSPQRIRADGLRRKFMSL